MSKNRQTIQFQLLMIMLLMAMITVGLGVTSMWQSHQIASKTKEISQVWLPGVQHVLNLRAQANRLRRAEAELYTSAPELVDSADLQKEIASVRESIIDTENKLQALNTSGEGADLMQTYLAKRGEYFAFQDKMLALRNSADATSQQEAAKAYFKEYKKLFISVAETSGKVAKMFVKSSEAAHAEVAAMEERANYVNLAVMVGAVMLAVGLGWWLAHRLAASLRRAVAVAEQVAEGNLTVQIETHDKSEVGDVMRALLGMRNHLAEIVGKVRTDAEIVAHASAEISQGNLDLSTRTETQASSLEKTNHSILQFSESAAKNAGEAQQASALAQHASGVAASGGQAMTAVVDTMAQISNSSHRIADIISVIEGIAFQTNILALNAAVEAARAGEEGRGFAVVAGEVRSLAQRSANAAKEIKSLIDESVAHVSVGGSQVKDAGATVGELVDAIGKVSSLVSNIASSSAAQAADVREVSHAVQEMDTMTQQNAALVEEAAAAAASLRQQSDSLLEVMRVFQLEAPGHAAAPHAAVA